MAMTSTPRTEGRGWGQSRGQLGWRTGWKATGAMAVAGAACIFTSTALAQDWEEPVRRGDQLIYPRSGAVPRHITPVERDYMRDFPLTISQFTTDQPTGPVYCPPEYAPMDAILFSWRGSSTWLNILAQMGAHITTTGDADLYIAVQNQSTQNSAFNALNGQGADMSRVRFVTRYTDSIWIRDYGPRYIYEGNTRVIIDHTYEAWSRVNDNAYPSHFKNVTGHGYYEIPLVHGGGNFHLDSNGWGYATRLINQTNPGLTETEIKDLWLAYQNLDMILYNRFPSWADGTGHIDMWMQVVGPEDVIISTFPTDPNGPQQQICDDAAADFLSRNFNVHRVPARLLSGVHYTYTNMVICNDLVLLPFYTNSNISPYNAQVLATVQAALPDKTVVQINTQGIVSASGVMHCIVMHMPEHLGGQNPTAYLRTPRGGESFEPGDEVTVRWFSDDRDGVETFDLLLTRDGGETFETIVAGLPDTNEYTWTVPDIYAPDARLFVVVRNAANRSGFDGGGSFEILGDPGEIAPIVDGDITFGTWLTGTLESLAEPNDELVTARSQFGFTVIEPNLIELKTLHETNVADPVEMTLLVRTRLNTPGGRLRVRLVDPDTNTQHLVASHPLGTEMTDFSIEPIDAGPFIDADGGVEVRIRQSIVATFSLTGFHGEFDHVELRVR